MVYNPESENRKVLLQVKLRCSTRPNATFKYSSHHMLNLWAKNQPIKIQHN